MLDTVPHDLAADGKPLPMREPSREVAYEPRALSVLVVEDDQGDFCAMERSLKRMSRYEASITLAGDLAAARFALASNNFDVVFVDYSLREEIGIDLLRFIDHERASCPVILATGMLTTEIEAEAMELGVAACLPKDDVTPKVIETVIRQSMLSHDLLMTLHTMGQSDLARAKLKHRPA